jgi:Ca2+/H+ antiporter, TMEM165/GDT1 family
VTLGLVVLATFLAAAVEWVEALTIVLAVGIVKSWRTALLATAAALGVLALLVLVFGFAVTSYVSVSTVRTMVGVGLLLFGLGWLYKAILRSSGLKALHDEAAAFQETREEVMTHGHAFGTAFGGVFLEGLEVVFIVVALGGLKFQAAATVGALASLVVVCVAGVFVRRPLTRVPENMVKYAVGVMLTSFGTFFAGEGLGVDWWNGDIVLLPMIAGYAVASWIFVQYLVRRESLQFGQLAGLRPVRAAMLEVWGLFVTDGTLAIFAVAALLLVAVFVDRVGGQRSIAGWVLVTGVLLAIAVALRGAARATAQAKASEPQRVPSVARHEGPEPSLSSPTAPA